LSPIAKCETSVINKTELQSSLRLNANWHAPDDGAPLMQRRRGQSQQRRRHGRAQ
jgi:hypothetical protein